MRFSAHFLRIKTGSNKGWTFLILGDSLTTDIQYIQVFPCTQCELVDYVLTCPSLLLLPERRSSRPPRPHQADSAFPSWAHTSSTGWSWDCNTPPCPCFPSRRAILLRATVSEIVIFHPSLWLMHAWPDAQSAWCTHQWRKVFLSACRQPNQSGRSAWGRARSTRKFWGCRPGRGPCRHHPLKQHRLPGNIKSMNKTCSNKRKNIFTWPVGYFVASKRN